MNSGIYKIRNTVTDDFYIGSAVNIKSRFNHHRSELKKKKHPNIILQRVYNKYGLEKLAFELIETIENKDALIEREQFFIDNLKPKYNICKVAGSSLGLTRSKRAKCNMSIAKKNDIRNTARLVKLNKSRKGKKLSEEHRAKISEAGKKRKTSAETRAKISEALKGRKHSVEARAKMSASLKLWYKEQRKLL